MKIATCLMIAVMATEAATRVAAQDEIKPSAETLPRLENGRPPQNLSQMWDGFDPRAEPLETEILKEWEEDGVVLRVVRFHIGFFKGKPARLAAVYGFPKGTSSRSDRVPGLLQIHGGGQYADYQACLANAKRGYATLSIAWAGRISAPGYRVSPAEVKLFWDGRTEAPNYRMTTDWGAVDGYHAPGRNAGNHFPSARPHSWTLDNVESPRNSGWFLCALAARRALTFLEKQPEVDPQKLGVYGHSMGGKLTVMTAIDQRVKAAAPSCGGISDRYNDSALFRATLGDDVSLKRVCCPIVFLSPSNDFHGRLVDLADAVAEIQSDQWRVTCSPHHNHQDTDEYEVATLLWFDEHLKGAFRFPSTPETELTLRTPNHSPELSIKPDTSMQVLSVDVYYTTQGNPDERPKDRLDTIHRFWHHVSAKKTDGTWTASLPLSRADKPLWVYANVLYPLNEPVSGAGYYYRIYNADQFNLSSLMTVASANELKQSDVRAALESSTMIEDFSEGWEKEWFTYRPSTWGRSTNKLNSKIWKAPKHGDPKRIDLVLRVRASHDNTMVVVLDEYAAEIQLAGGKITRHTFQPTDFKNHAGETLQDWNGIRLLKLSAEETLRPVAGQETQPKKLGGKWNGEPPQFHSLSWEPSSNP